MLMAVEFWASETTEHSGTASMKVENLGATFTE